MSRKKRQDDRIRMHVRAFLGGEDQYAVRLTTGRMNQEISRLKKSLALRDRKLRLFKEDIKERLLSNAFLLDFYPHKKKPSEELEQKLHDLRVQRKMLEVLLVDLETIEKYNSAELDSLESNLAKEKIEVEL